MMVMVFSVANTPHLVYSPGSHKMKGSMPGIFLVYTSNRTVNIADAGTVYFLYIAQCLHNDV